MKKSISMLITIFLIGVILTGCAEPSPFIGTWADNKGDQITFMADDSFTATIIDSQGIKSRAEGSYTVLLNAVTFSTTTGRQIVSEWDIRGNMMYLIWTDENGISISLTLYKIKN
ncbi:MAG: hypothetical protein J6B81_02835 [Spirochaetaceae bacterium]|nr:hypothetical protein [Spirochaetaceae bacterium]